MELAEMAKLIALIREKTHGLILMLISSSSGVFCVKQEKNEIMIYMDLRTKKMSMLEKNKSYVANVQ